MSRITVSTSAEAHTDLTWLCGQVGILSRGKALALVLRWVVSDPARLAAFRAYVQAQAAE